ncbi:MAG: peptidyl-tRNA hydrolase [Candidatus Hadarchaeum yellowstonense]|uniref:Peptidyl-tRNA hydrolase n=1 Tax=Hadarchaeum yellowstonense TaxID=1776334 RepID=A0A147K1J0_HADYE|nr:MAG: peptidyl-tRNA hydrolase [Candidatus Hadarchaeum yellowstonense]
MFKYKQVIVVRADLKMSPGKIAAQVAHGSVGAAEMARKKHRRWFSLWFSEGQKKVVVKVNSERELLDLKKKADSLGLPNMLIQDAGLTELPPGTVTALGIGPAPNEILDQVTGGLPLL